MDNTVLNPDELRALPDGMRVWIEMRRPGDKEFSGWNVKIGNSLVCLDSAFGFTIGGPGHTGERFRVWAEEPSADESKAARWT